MNYSSSDSNSDIDEEEAPLFFPPSNNFNSATIDPKSGRNINGVAFAVDYEKSRRERREKAMRKQFEAFDIEMEDSKHLPWYSFRCLSYILVCVLFVTCSIAILLRLQNRKEAIKPEHKLMHHHAPLPSSRWGRRFDDDDDSSVAAHKEKLVPAYEAGRKGSTHIPKYHSHGHNANKPHKKKLTPKDMELDIEEWEEYEMEVSHLLSNSKPGWDIYQKNHQTSGSPESHNTEESAHDCSNCNRHWIQYFDQESNEPYYFNIETNITQWDKPVASDIAMVYDYESGELKPVN